MRLIPLILLLALSPQGTPEETDFAARGAEVLRPFKAQLMSELKGGLEEGVGEAIVVCSIRAPHLAEAAGSDTVAVGRTSHKLRNRENAPREWVAPLLEEYVSGVRKEPAVVEFPGGGAGYVEPIRVASTCLVCHGESIDAKVAGRIREIYPDDEAVGFRSGDFRGLFWVEFAGD
jgi:hypothetical protein